MIEIKNLNKSFGQKEVLSRINCRLDNGIYGFLGKNGAGKTTLMRCLAGIYGDWNGEILVNGKPAGRKTVMAGYLPQSFGLFRELKVLDMMRYLASAKKIPKAGRDSEIMRCLRAVYMEERTGSRVGALSGGMVRRLGIAQALMGRPGILLFDEPTAGLDPEERMHFKNILSGLGKEETVIVSTHIVEDIEACCDAVIIIDSGKILRVGTCKEIADTAAGRVYVCPKGEETNITQDYVMEKQFEKDGEICYRILSAATLPFVQVEPTLEDGYLCIQKMMDKKRIRGV